VKQGCPLAPYLFLMVEKVLNVVVKEELGTNRLQGIKLPKFHKQQLIARYVDDTNFTIKVPQTCTERLAIVLDIFC
jgi:hypothetical protein